MTDQTTKAVIALLSEHVGETRGHGFLVVCQTKLIRTGAKGQTSEVFVKAKCLLERHKTPEAALEALRGEG